MKQYLTNLTQRFDDSAHLARFLNVSIHTLHSWKHGRRVPGGPDFRLLEVLGMLASEAPAMLAVLTESTRQVKQPKPKAVAPIVMGPYAFEVKPLSPETKQLLLEAIPVKPVAIGRTQVQRENQIAWDAGEYDNVFTAEPYRSMMDDEYDLAYEAFKAKLGVR